MIAGPNESRSRVFSPRMDYDEWTPLGRGDPLKNDPTFDYVPPVLDRVQYWLDSQTTEPSVKRDILILGVTAKKTSPKIPEHFFKFVDGPKFNRNQETSFRNDFPGSTGAEPPKIIRTNSFRSGPMDYRNQNRIQSIPASYYPSPFYNQKSKPYTMMMPPPRNQKPINELGSYGNPLTEKIIFADSPQQFSTQTEEGPTLEESQIYNHPQKTFSQSHPPLRSTHSHASSSSIKPKHPIMIHQIESIQGTFIPSSQIPTQRFEATTPSVSVEKSNLIYQSTQIISDGWIGTSRPTSSPPSVEINQITWKTPDKYEVDHHGSASANHEIVIGQNANIIVDGDTNGNEEVVIGHKGVQSEQGLSQESQENSKEVSSATDIQSIKPSIDLTPSSNAPNETEKMHIVVANSPSSFELENQKEPISVVMPTNYVERKQNSNHSSTEYTNGNSDKNTNTMNQNENSMSQDNSKLQQSNSMTSQDFIRSPEFSSSQEFMGSHSSLERPAQVSKPQPFRSSISSPMMPLFMEDTPTAYPFNIPSNRIPPTRHTPSRHPGFQMLREAAPQHLALQNPRPMTMHRPGETHPGFRPHMSMTMGQVSPSMIHFHMPPPQGIMGPPISTNQAFQRHQQPTFTNSPTGTDSTLTLQVTRMEDQAHWHSSIADSMILTTMQSSMFTPTTRRPVTINEDFLDYTKNHSPLLQLLNSEQPKKMEMGSSTVFVPSPSSIQTTTVPSLTTDPLFSHYKQPVKPIRGPMYLIIQGHSKVKTYKPTVNKYGFSVENNEIVDNTTERPQSKLEKLINENAKNNAVVRDKDLNAKKKLDEKKEKRDEMKSLLNLVENGFSSFTVSPSVVTENERQSNSVTTIEINAN